MAPRRAGPALLAAAMHTAVGHVSVRRAGVRACVRVAVHLPILGPWRSYSRHAVGDNIHALAAGQLTCNVPAVCNAPCWCCEGCTCERLGDSGRDRVVLAASIPQQNTIPSPNTQPAGGAISHWSGLGDAAARRQYGESAMSRRHSAVREHDDSLGRLERSSRAARHTAS